MPNRAAHLLQRAAHTPDHVALIYEGETVTFEDLEAKVQRAAGVLKARGVKQGDHAGLWLPSTIDFIVAQQALFFIGAVVTPLNVMYRPGEIWHAAECCALSWIVTSAELASSFEQSEPCPLILVNDLSESESAPVGCGRLADVGDTTLAMLLLTSATTGKAKGVMLTSGNLAANYDRTPGWLGLDGSSVILCALPLYNTFGLNQGINAMLATGCKMVLMPRFDAEKCIAAIAEHRCTFLPAVPTMLQKIVDHPSATRDTLGSLRKIMTGGAPVPSALLQRLTDLAPHVELLTGYGLTEGTALVTLTPVQLNALGVIERERTIGRVLDGMEIMIADENGQAQPIGGTGEILIRGPNVMAGYFRAPDDSAAALENGWLHTGDIGYLDAEGYAFIVDRKKDVIIRGGQNIYPADIEEILYQVAGVAEAAVVANPDSLLGEVPIAFVSLRGEHHPTVEQMIEHCRASLANFKVPAKIEIRDELPKGPTGKILRRALRPAQQGA